MDWFKSLTSVAMGEVREAAEELVKKGPEIQRVVLKTVLPLVIPVVDPAGISQFLTKKTDALLTASNPFNRTGDSIQRSARFFQDQAAGQKLRPGEIDPLWMEAVQKVAEQYKEWEIDPHWVEAYQEMAVQSKAWGFDFKADNPIHILMALSYEGNHPPQNRIGNYSLADIKKAYGKIEAVLKELEKSISKDMSPKEKSAKLYEIIQNKYPYSDTNDFLKGLFKGSLDCDTGAIFFLTVAPEMEGGWPVHMVSAPQHAFVRWDDDFNMDLEGTGNKPDEYYKDKYSISKPAIDNGAELRSLKPKELIGHFFALKAYALQDRGQLEAALPYFGQAISLNDRNFEAIFYRGLAFYQMDQVDRGHADMKEAKRLRPFHHSAFFIPIIEDYKRGNYLEAERALLAGYPCFRAAAKIQGVFYSKWRVERLFGALGKALLSWGIRDFKNEKTFKAENSIDAAGLLFGALPEKKGSQNRESWMEFYYYKGMLEFQSNNLQDSKWNFQFFIEDFSAYKDDPDVSSKQIKKYQKLYKESLLRLGQIYTNEDYPSKAQRTFQKVLAIDSENTEARLALAWLKSNESWAGIEAAIEVFNKILSQDPQNQEAKLGMAWMYYNKRNYVLAQSFFNQIPEKIPNENPPHIPKENPLHLEAVLGKAYLHYEKKEYPEAEMKFQTVLQKDPQDTGALLGLGMVYYRQKDYSSSIKMFEKVLKTDPMDLGAILGATAGLGWVHYEQGRYNRAEEHFKGVLEQNQFRRQKEDTQPRRYTYRLEDATALYGLGMVYYRREELENAHRILKEAYRLDPIDPELKADFEKVDVEYKKLKRN